MLCLSTMHAMINGFFFQALHVRLAPFQYCMSYILKQLKSGVFIFQIFSSALNYLTGKPTADFVELSHYNQRRFYG